MKSPLRDSIAQAADRNITQYEDTLSVMHMRPQSLRPNQVENNRAIVAKGFEMSGATHGSIETLLVRTEEYIAGEADLARVLLRHGAILNRFQLIIRMKREFQKTQNPEDAVQTALLMGCRADVRDALITALGIMVSLENSFQAAMTLAVDEMFIDAMKKLLGEKTVQE